MSQTVTSGFTNLVGPWIDRIDAALAGYVNQLEFCPRRLRDAMAYSVLAPGKRLRPLSVLLAAEACNGSIESALPAACAVEMVHAYSLVHDDLPAMDDDDLRRGRPTCHRQFDEATAILAGDALLTLAFETLANHVRPPEVAATCCATLAEFAGASGLVGGQADDLQSENGHPDLALLESIHQRKTGALFIASLRLGGIVAMADEDQINSLAEYGRCIGLAFQITDDLLDVTGNEQVVGKRIGKDASHGKLTFPGSLGVEESKRRTRELIEAACRAIADLGSSAAGLESAARYVLERNR